MRRPLHTLVLAVVLVLAAACSEGDGEVDREASRALEEQIDLVQFAASAQEYEAARRGLEEVRATAVRFSERGAIDDPRLVEILAAIEDLDEALGAAEPSA